MMELLSPERRSWNEYAFNAGNDRQTWEKSFVLVFRDLEPKRRIKGVDISWGAMELLSNVRRNPVTSIRALAKALGRDYSNVHADVQALAGAGLLDSTSKGVRADYDAIETRIAI
jgi:hypothetical protein